MMKFPSNHYMTKDTCDKHHKEDCMACFYTTPPVDMTTDKVKEKIQSLCPDVMKNTDLQDALDALGMMYGQYCSERGHLFMSAGETASTVLERWQMFSDDGTGRGEVRDVEVLSPITLAVVLRAIETTILNRCIFISASGRFYEERAGQEVQLTAGHWNLSLDNYDDQTQETKDFIGSLLNV